MPSIAYLNTISPNNTLVQRPHHMLRWLADLGWEVLWVEENSKKGYFREIDEHGIKIYYNTETFFKKFNGKIDVLFMSWSKRYEDIEKLNPKFVVYDSLDKFSSNEEFEESACKSSDLVFTTTERLKEERSIFNNNIYVLPNGCFTNNAYKNYDVPEDMSKYPKPWILFSGALSDSTMEHGWCDLDLMKAVSEKYTTFVVGKQWNISPQNNYKLKNVHMLGTKSYGDLMAYYKHCDVNILPFADNQIAQYSQPLKVIEAMSHGKINVCTNMHEVKILKEKCPNGILIAENTNDFINKINIAVNKKDEFKQEIMECAKEYDWNIIVNKMDRIMREEMLKKGVLFE